MQRDLATKIRAKRESGLTVVRLKRDPPVHGQMTVNTFTWNQCVLSDTKIYITQDRSLNLHVIGRLPVF